MRSFDIYLVASLNQRKKKDFFEIIIQSLKAGIDCIQLREKSLSSRDFYELALELKRLCDDFNIPLIINDRIDIALSIDASGVHLGQEDLPVKKAREILGKDKIIGLSLNQEYELEDIEGADYLGVGALEGTPSKKDCKVIGISGLKNIVSKTCLPVVAIGGINDKMIESLKGIRLSGIAVIRAIMDSQNPYESTLKLKKAFNSYIKNYKDNQNP